MAIKIGIDVGHGLYTPGKQTPTGIKEWTLNDKVRDKVVEFLADYDCEFVHVDNNEGNVDESLESRVNKYISAGVAVLVSLHHNAFTGTWNKATGVEAWVDRNATAEDVRLAECIYKRMVEYTGLTGRGIKREDWAVINQNRIPAVLFEGGFMDSSIDYKVITSDEGQTAYARAVAEGLIEYCKLKKKATPNPSQTKVYTVVKGDTLSDIAEKYGKTWKELADYNGITNPHIIWIGQKIKIPTEAVKTPTLAVGSTVRVKSGAKDINGTPLADFVYKRNHKVKEINGDRVVITYRNAVVCAIHKNNLILA